MRTSLHAGRTAVATLACASALAPAATALGAKSVGSAEQVAWVRSAATRFVAAELAGNGEVACAILNRPLRANKRGRTCAQRWDARLSTMLHGHAARAALRRQAEEIPHARVVVRGDVASIQLSKPLFEQPRNSFIWTENCWMLRG